MKTSLELFDMEFRPVTSGELISRCKADTHDEYDIYISGPMSGLEEFNYHRFDEVASWLRSFGLRVFNPAENFNGMSTLVRKMYLKKDIAAVIRSGAILLLEGWEESAGANVELHVAHETELKIFTVDHYKFYEIS